MFSLKEFVKGVLDETDLAEIQAKIDERNVADELHPDNC